MKKTKEEKILLILKIIFFLELLFIPLTFLVYTFGENYDNLSAYCSMAICTSEDYTDCTAYGIGDDGEQVILWEGSCKPFFENQIGEGK